MSTPATIGLDGDAKPAVPAPAATPANGAPQRQHNKDSDSSSSTSSSRSRRASSTSSDSSRQKKKKKDKQSKKEKKKSKRDKKDKAAKKSDKKKDAKSVAAPLPPQPMKIVIGAPIARSLQIAKAKEETLAARRAQFEAQRAEAEEAARKAAAERAEKKAAEARAMKEAEERAAAAYLAAENREDDDDEEVAEDPWVLFRASQAATGSTTKAASAAKRMVAAWQPLSLSAPVASHSTVVGVTPTETENALSLPAALDGSELPVASAEPVVARAAAAYGFVADEAPSAATAGPFSSADAAGPDDETLRRQLLVEMARAAQWKEQPLAGATGNDDHEDDEDDDGDDAIQNLVEVAKATGHRGSATTGITTQLDFHEDDALGKGPRASAGGGPGASTTPSAARVLKMVDHATIAYEPFQKVFYHPPPDVEAMSEEEVTKLRRELDGAKVWGAHPPKPLKSWVGCGLNDAAMDTLRAKGFERPFAIQAMAMPILMSGRDLLAIAKTGSGKTLAYLLPLVRHVHAQRRAVSGEGPIGLIIVPTRELAEQVGVVAKDFCAASHLKLVLSYGGLDLKRNIGECRRGCDVMIATPGRLFELLTTNRGRVVNLKRVTFVTIDEADRMFDEGFSRHIVEYLARIRPDRQVCMCSSVMPKDIRKIVKACLGPDFLELSVGGKASPSSNVHQTIEVFEPAPTDDGPVGTVAAATLDKRFLRLLQILGDEPAESLVMIFVSNKETCDDLFFKLTERGFQGAIAVIYSSMDQIDREFSLQQFTQRRKTILIATGVAERGIDVVGLELVINYDLPDHYEAYVNRVGRTGRAGRKGRAVSFLCKDRASDRMLAWQLVTGLEESGNTPSEDLRGVALQEREAAGNGLVRISEAAGFNKGYKRARGYAFSAKERRRLTKDMARTMGLEEFMSSDSDKETDGFAISDDDDAEGDGARRKASDPIISIDEQVVVDSDEAQPIASTALVVADGSAQARLEAARKAAMQLTVSTASELLLARARYTINDFSARVRSKLVHRDFYDQIATDTGTVITVKGKYHAPPHHLPRDDERLLHWLIRGHSSSAITQVFRKIDEIVEEDGKRLGTLQSGGFTGKKDSKR